MKQNLCRQGKTVKNHDYCAVLDNIDASLDDDEDVGPDVDEKLAAITNKAFSKHLSIDVVKKKKDAYSRPKNCDKVIVPKINKEIWRQMAKQNFVKKRDLRFMSVQSAITKSTCAVLQVAEKLLKLESNENNERMIRTCIDAVFLMGHANTSLSLQRRDLLKPVLKSDHAGLCDSNIPITSMLFGDDLPKSLKEVRQVDNVGRDYPSKNWKRQGYNKPRNEYWNKPGSSGIKKGRKKFRKD